ncbi:MAG: hypothetical protein DRJ40_11230 [Thermoprotei archaeon]|nr:MAG: hypothetical protein DRJ40_11230 [Thermoprotei archaeon]
MSYSSSSVSRRNVVHPVASIRDELREKGYAVVDFYAVNPPHAYTVIAREITTGRLMYFVIEPPLSEEDHRVLKELKELLYEECRDLDSFPNKGSEEVLRKYIESKVRDIINKYSIELPRPEALSKYMYYLIRDFIGYGKIDSLMRDPYLEDILCDGVGSPIYVWHRFYESMPTNIVFDSLEELESFVTKLAYRAGKQISIADPIVEGSLPDGSRVHITLTEVSRRGPTFSIRRFSIEVLTIIDLLIQNTISVEEAAYLWYLVDNMRTIIITGATGAGKTTLLNAIAMFIRPECRVITIEEVPELRLPHEHWVPLVARPSREAYVRDVTLFDLLKSSLRMRPDYIIVGEIRGEEAFVLFQALATGHAGLCTMHAESIEYAIRRLLTKPMNIPPILIPLANVFIHISRVKLGDRIVRRVVRICEVEDVDEKGNVKIRDIFRWTPLNDKHEKIGDSVVLRRIAEVKFIHPTHIEQELKRRATILKTLMELKLRDFATVSKVIREYYYRPELVYLRATAKALP